MFFFTGWVDVFEVVFFLGDRVEYGGYYKEFVEFEVVDLGRNGFLVIVR